MATKISGILAALALLMLALHGCGYLQSAPEIPRHHWRLQAFGRDLYNAQGRRVASQIGAQAFVFDPCCGEEEFESAARALDYIATAEKSR